MSPCSGPLRGPAVALALALAAVLFACTPGAPDRERSPAERPVEGLVVEQAEPGHAAWRAGIRPGDVLVGWSEASSPEGAPAPVTPLGSAAALWYLERTAGEAGRKIVLLGRRGERPLDGQPPAGPWRIAVRPPLAPEALATYGALRDDPAAGSAAAWRELAADQQDPAAALWVLLRGGRRLLATEAESRTRVATGPDSGGKAGAETGGSSALFDAAVARADGDDRLALWAWAEIGAAQAEVSALAAAAAAYDAALERAAPAATGADGLVTAALAQARGIVSFRLGEKDLAELFYRQALALVRERAPGGDREASLLVDLAKVERNHGRFDAAELLLGEALPLASRASPTRAAAYEELGVVADRRGDLASAQRNYRQALELYRELGIEDKSTAAARMGLGIVAWHRGDLATAEEEFRQAHGIFAREAPGSTSEAWSLQGLGVVAADRGDDRAAERYQRRALAILFATRPDSLDGAQALGNLGSVLAGRDDHAGARQAFEQALDILEIRLPGSKAAQRARANLAAALVAAGELDAAEASLRQALAGWRELAPDSLDEAGTRLALGELLTRRDRLPEARRELATAVALRRRWAPGSAAEALALHALGGLERRAGRAVEAHRLLLAAVEVLEQQEERLGGSYDDRSRFAARFARLYKDLIELSLELGQPEEAFHLLERYRARGLLALTAERDLLLEAELPPELAAESQRVRRRYQQVRSRLASLDPGATDSEAAALLAELGGLRDRRKELAAALRRAAPRLAELRYPQPLDLEAAGRILAPGTALVSYAVGEDDSWLFALAPGAPGAPPALEVHRLGVGAAELAREVESFRLLLQSPAGGAVARQALAARGQRLYRQLVAPAATALASARRLLVIPDGPLNLLPFSALVLAETGAAGEAGPRFLVERLPVRTAVSMTVLATLATGEAAGRSRLAAFGAPQDGVPAGTAAALRVGAARPPLPGARREVAAIGRLFGSRAELFTGRAATERRAREVAPRVDLLHFACHGVVDERFPLDSFLALSPAPKEGDDGRLEAWEIFEQLRIDADLVTLSACDTGLGQGRAGDGLVGLTYAFRYAGARSLVATQWQVADRSAALLMPRFYARLRRGEPYDEALRGAQLEMIRGRGASPASGPGGGLSRLLARLPGRGPGEEPAAAATDLSHPFHWAAFQLTGARR